MENLTDTRIPATKALHGPTTSASLASGAPASSVTALDPSASPPGPVSVTSSFSTSLATSPSPPASVGPGSSTASSTTSRSPGLSLPSTTGVRSTSVDTLISQPLHDGLGLGAGRGPERRPGRRRQRRRRSARHHAEHHYEHPHQPNRLHGDGLSDVGCTVGQLATSTNVRTTVADLFRCRFAPRCRPRPWRRSTTARGSRSCRPGAVPHEHLCRDVVRHRSRHRVGIGMMRLSIEGRSAGVGRALGGRAISKVYLDILDGASGIPVWLGSGLSPAATVWVPLTADAKATLASSGAEIGLGVFSYPRVRRLLVGALSGEAKAHGDLFRTTATSNGGENGKSPCMGPLRKSKP